MERQPASTRKTPGSPKTPKPRSRFQRAPAGALALTARDARLLSDLFLHRAMTRGQVQDLFFGSVARCNLRLRQLFDHGYLDRAYPREAPYGAQAVYSVARKAAPVVAHRLDMDEEQVRSLLRKAPSPLALSHTIEAVRVYMAFRRSIEGHAGIALELWLPELLCRHEFEIQDTRDKTSRWRSEAFKPDGFLRLAVHVSPSSDVPDYHSFFLEVDLGHVSAGKFTEKLKSYQRYRESRLFQEVYGTESFDVLVVTTGERRMENLRQLAAENGRDEFRFTTFEAVEKTAEGPLAAIWRRTGGGAAQRLVEGPSCSA